MKILCVCLGNICRSPLAEGVLKKVANENQVTLEVRSAGTASYHIGDHADYRTVQIGNKHKIDISSHRGQQFSVEHFDQFDLILVMDKSNLHNVRNLARNQIDLAKINMYRRDGKIVDDPYYGDMTDFEKMYQVLHEHATHWVLLEKK
jgi:protein-tyrosine phosphatase